jgi:hypothetical protein
MLGYIYLFYCFAVLGMEPRALLILGWAMPQPLGYPRYELPGEGRIRQVCCRKDLRDELFPVCFH